MDQIYSDNRLRFSHVDEPSSFSSNLPLLRMIWSRKSPRWAWI